jgi:hypothetical protein
MEYIKIADFYGGEFKLLLNSQSKFKSIIGGLLSIITTAVFIWAVLMFGRGFYNRTNPYVKISNGLTSNITSLNSSYYSEKIIMLKLDKTITKYATPSILQPNINMNFTFIKFPLCTKDNFIKDFLYSEEAYNVMQEYYNSYCFRLNDFLIVSKAHRSILPLSIGLVGCLNKYTYPDLDYSKCDMSVNGTTFEETFIVLSVWKMMFNSDFKQPIHFRENEYSTTVIRSREMSISIPITPIIFVDDEGWILTDNLTQRDIDFQSWDKKENNNISFLANYPTFTIEFPMADEQQTIYRSYEKFQDFLARVGGFMKIVFSFLSFFNYLISQYLLDKHIDEKVFSSPVLHEYRKNEMEILEGNNKQKLFKLQINTKVKKMDESIFFNIRIY